MPIIIAAAVIVPAGILTLRARDAHRRAHHRHPQPTADAGGHVRIIG